MSLPSNLAQLKLFPNRFQIVGPPELVVSVQVITSNKTSHFRDQLDDLLDKWYVGCSVSGEAISLYDLRYWDVPKQQVYARPELVPLPDCYKDKS